MLMFRSWINLFLQQLMNCFRFKAPANGNLNLTREFHSHMYCMISKTSHLHCDDPLYVKPDTELYSNGYMTLHAIPRFVSAARKPYVTFTFHVTLLRLVICILPLASKEWGRYCFHKCLSVYKEGAVPRLHPIILLLVHVLSWGGGYCISTP